MAEKHKARQRRRGQDITKQFRTLCSNSYKCTPQLKMLPSTRSQDLRAKDAPQRYFKGKDDKDTLWPNFYEPLYKTGRNKRNNAKIIEGYTEMHV
jgi:hypothetical protein